MWFLRWTQVPRQAGELRASFSLQLYMGGKWGYVFRYEMGELHVYRTRRDPREKEGVGDQRPLRVQSFPFSAKCLGCLLVKYDVFGA